MNTGKTMKVIALNLENVENSQQVRTELDVNTDVGIERVSKTLFDTGVANTTLAIEADGIEIKKITNMKFDLIAQIDNTLYLVTGEIDGEGIDPSIVSDSGLLPDDTLFIVTNVTTVSMTSSVVNRQEVLNPDIESGEVTTRATDICSTALGGSIDKISALALESGGVINVGAYGVNGNASNDDTVINAANKLITLVSREVVTTNKDITSSFVDTSNIVGAGTYGTPFSNVFSSQRSTGDDMFTEENKFLFEELVNVSSSGMPPVTVGHTDLFCEDITKELAMVISRIIKALSLFSQISMIVDTFSGKSLISGKVIYAPGINTSLHAVARMDPTLLVKTAIEELAILTYGADVGGGYLMVAITKLVGEPSIIINITSELASSEYIIRDDSSYYTTLVNDRDTLKDLAILSKETVQNVATQRDTTIIS